MRFRRLSRLTLALALPVALAACVPANSNTTVSPYSVGTAGIVSYGTVVGMTPVQVTGTRTGVGAGVGAVSGSVIGSTIGGDWRARTVATVAGGLIGGLAGAGIEEGVTSGQAVRFVVRVDRGPDIEVVQTNEIGLRPGDRVAISQGDRIRLSRADNVFPAPMAPRAAK